MPVNIQLSKIQIAAFSYPRMPYLLRYGLYAWLNYLVGLGRIELPTSPLSGVRSSQLSYRPMAGSYLVGQPWWSWSGSNRRPPECKSGALPAELQPRLFFRGRLDAATRE